MATCPKCYGSCTITCSDCNGIGNKFGETCYTCHASGKVTCPTCYGTGNVADGSNSGGSSYDSGSSGGYSGGGVSDIIDDSISGKSDFDQGVSFENQGQLNDAIDSFTKAIDKTKRSILTAKSASLSYVKRGIVYYKLQQYNNAIEDLLSAIDYTYGASYKYFPELQKDTQATAKNVLGAAFYAMGNLNSSNKESAISYWKEAADLGSKDAVNNLANNGIQYTPKAPKSSTSSSSSESAGRGSIIFGIIGAVVGGLIGSTIISFLGIGFIGGAIGGFFLGKWLSGKILGKILMIVALAFVGGTFIINKLPSKPKNETAVTAQASATVNANVNFRSGPSTDNAVIRQLKQGDAVTLTGETNGGWTQIKHGNDTGWVSATYLTSGTAQAAPQQTQTQEQPSTQTATPQAESTAGEIAQWARGNYGNIAVNANSITGGNINITGARTIIQPPLSGHPNLRWAYIYAGDKKYGVVWDRTTYANSWHEGIELGMGSEARSVFDFYSGQDKDSIFSDIAPEAPSIKVVK